MRFKEGDKVRVLDRCTTGGWASKVGKVSADRLFFNRIPVVFNDCAEKYFKEDDLELITEEETSMKFKVGDKVKVSNSWEGRSGMIGKITDTDNDSSYSYTVTFEGNGNESFKEEELELVKEKAEKQSFTKSDLKTGMGVVLRDGSKGHVLLGTEAGDIIRFIDEDGQQWGSVDEYDENMVDCDMSIMDIVEVYSSKYAYCYLTNRVFNQDCVFKREEPKPEPTKMTMKEINEHFGKAIEIIE